jgi:hypothetical protein
MGSVKSMDHKSVVLGFCGFFFGASSDKNTRRYISYKEAR